MTTPLPALTCSELRKRLPELADGSLTFDPQGPAARHLAECGRCGREAQAYLAAAGKLKNAVALTAAARVPLPAGNVAARRILESEAARSRPRARWLAATGILVAIAFGFAVWRPVQPDRFATQPDAQVRPSPGAPPSGLWVQDDPISGRQVMVTTVAPETESR
jgi:hypothetical protein